MVGKIGEFVYLVWYVWFLGDFCFVVYGGFFGWFYSWFKFYVVIFLVIIGFMIFF